MASKTSSKSSKDTFLSPGRIISDIVKRKDEYWIKKQETETLELFHEAAKRVPAYKRFLSEHNIDHTKIKNLEDFKQIPYTTKENYLKKYPLNELSWDGKLNKALVFTSTSGSTGVPQYFSRNDKVDWQSSVMHELFLKNVIENLNQPTLVIIGFGMGVWIGGLITYEAFHLVAKRGYPISIITPGINKEEIFKILRDLSPSFGQTIIVGYPPFVKDVIDEAPQRGIDLKGLNIKLLFAAEAFTEKFRDHLLGDIGKNNPFLNSTNIYGSADIGTMAYETPISILIRRLAIGRPKVFEKIFKGVKKTPTLAQFIPGFISFEAENGELALTGNSSMPLMRYRIGDHGGVYSFKELESMLEDEGINLVEEAKANEIGDKIYELPFVYVFERVDFSTTLYGLQIYPETIKEVLLDAPFNKFLTGKITLETKFSAEQDQYLEINLELQRGKGETSLLKGQLLNSILKNLRDKNSEFRELSSYLNTRVIPRLVFWPFEDPEHFKPGIKQQWVKK